MRKHSYSTRTPKSRSLSTSSPDPPQQPTRLPPRQQTLQHCCHFIYLLKYPGQMGNPPLQEGTNT